MKKIKMLYLLLIIGLLFSCDKHKKEEMAIRNNLSIEVEKYERLINIIELTWNPAGTNVSALGVEVELAKKVYEWNTRGPNLELAKTNKEQTYKDYLINFINDKNNSIENIKRYLTEENWSNYFSQKVADKLHDLENGNLSSLPNKPIGIMDSQENREKRLRRIAEKSTNTETPREIIRYNSNDHDEMLLYNESIELTNTLNEYVKIYNSNKQNTNDFKDWYDRYIETNETLNLYKSNIESLKNDLENKKMSVEKEKRNNKIGGTIIAIIMLLIALPIIGESLGIFVIPFIPFIALKEWFGKRKGARK